MNNIDWIKSLKDKVMGFLELQSLDDYSYFKYSLSGDRYNKRHGWGLGQAVFAAKILYILKSIDGVSNSKVINIIKKIKAFQDDSGYISDGLIIKLITKKKSMFSKEITNIQDVENTKRAETRQAFSALSCLGQKPDRPFIHIPYSRDKIDDYLKGFDWKHPWHAGSHFSHLLFFYRLNQRMFGLESGEAEGLIEYASSWVDEMQSKEDGFWYSTETTIKEKINGAMKILTGKQAAGLSDIRYHERLIDGCLGAVNDSEACSNFNIIYVLYCCSKISDYRKKDIEAFCYDRLNTYREYFFEDVGGFSFYKNRANDIYYGARITKGLDEPDIHGTVLFTWGISLISKILGYRELFDIPLT